jgi:hypothetical protein
MRAPKTKTKSKAKPKFVNKPLIKFIEFYEEEAIKAYFKHKYPDTAKEEYGFWHYITNDVKNLYDDNGGFLELSREELTRCINDTDYSDYEDYHDGTNEMRTYHQIYRYYLDEFADINGKITIKLDE